MIATLSRGTKFGLQARFICQRQAFQILSGAHTHKIMVNRKGVFIGAYVPVELKESLRRRAALEHRTLSQEITRILIEAVHGKTLPPGSIDRRNPQASVPRRRATDPPERRRAEDLPYIPPGNDKDDKK
jgi:hypothetical protein